jgi:hypothetical protein
MYANTLITKSFHKNLNEFSIKPTISVLFNFGIILYKLTMISYSTG